MTKTKIDDFRNFLEARARELDRSARRLETIRIEGSADELDRRLGAASREFAVKKLEAENASLREARAALRRIAEGSFGECADCAEQIGAARLKALPWAALCIHCQEASDRIQFGMAA